MNRKAVSCLLCCSLFAQASALANQKVRKRQDPMRGQTSQKKSAPTASTAALDYYESHALIIGVSQYLNGWRDLPGVRRDVEEVSAALQKHGFQVTVKLNLKQAELDWALRKFVGAYGQNPKNRLVIYFAGHGHTLTTNDGRPLGYIVPADAPLPDDKNPGPFKSLAISMSDIEKFAREIESKHALFVFDSCFSGSLFRVRSNPVPDSISAMTDAQVRQFITAGTEKQSVPDESVFRKQFVKALAGEADYDRDGFITGTELGYFLRKTVTDYTRKMQTPESGKIRDPDLDKGDIVFISPLPATDKAEAKMQNIRSVPIIAPPKQEEELASPSSTAETGTWVEVENKTLVIQANETWTDTGIQIKPSQYVRLKVDSPEINLGSLGKVGPSGTSKNDLRKPARDCATGAVIARIGQELFCIEHGRSFTSANAGRLFIGLNEDNVTDNRGSFVVKVFIQELHP